jgi:hypothetical protein
MSKVSLTTSSVTLRLFSRASLYRQSRISDARAELDSVLETGDLLSNEIVRTDDRHRALTVKFRPRTPIVDISLLGLSAPIREDQSNPHMEGN